MTALRSAGPALSLALSALCSISGARASVEPPDAITYCLDCHGDEEMTMTLDDGFELRLYVPIDTYLDSVHGAELVCSDCHEGYDDLDVHPAGASFASQRAHVLASYELCRSCHFDTYTRTLESIHYELLRDGLESAPVCTDCHGAHGILDPTQKEAMLSRSCADCHRDIFESYSKSVHGKALHEEQIEDVPACVDCHTAHSIADPRTGSFHLSSPEICIECHGDEELMSKYDISTDVAATYSSDFHGVTATLANSDLIEPRQIVLTCVDCHGVHDIRSPDLMPIGEMQRRAQKVCSNCHEGAPGDFSDAWLSHYRPSLNHAPLVYLVDLFYKIFIPFVVVGLTLQVAMHLYRFAVRR